MADWTIEDHTRLRGGYLRLLRAGRRICDFFPFAKDEDEQFIRRQAKMIADLLNGMSSDDD